MPEWSPRCDVQVDGSSVPETELLRRELDRARVALALLKRKLGADGISSLLAEECADMDERARQEVASSDGEWTPAAVEIVATGCTAEHFFSWFHHRLVTSDEIDLLASHPEHYRITQAEGGGSDVIETTGHFQSPTRVLIKLGIPVEEACPISEDIRPELPIRMAGYGHLQDGTVVMRVLHQFADTDTGFRGRLCIYFPAKAAPERIEGHRWHLAIEFKNWISNCIGQLERGR